MSGFIDTADRFNDHTITRAQYLRMEVNQGRPPFERPDHYAPLGALPSHNSSPHGIRVRRHRKD